MRTITVSEARQELAETIATAQHEPVGLTKHNEVVAVVVGSVLFERLAQALEEFEDIRAIEAVRAAALPNLPWEEVKRELGLA